MFWDVGIYLQISSFLTTSFLSFFEGPPALFVLSFLWVWEYLFRIIAHSVSECRLYFVVLFIFVLKKKLLLQAILQGRLSFSSSICILTKLVCNFEVPLKKYFWQVLQDILYFIVIYYGQEAKRVILRIKSKIVFYTRPCRLHKARV